MRTFDKLALKSSKKPLKQWKINVQLKKEIFSFNYALFQIEGQLVKPSSYTSPHALNMYKNMRHVCDCVYAYVILFFLC